MTSDVRSGVRPTVALDAQAVEEIVSAATRKCAAVVAHSLPEAVAPTDPDFDVLAAQLPASWVRGLDGDMDGISGAPAELGPVLPHHRHEPTVVRIYHVQRSPRFKAITDSIYDPLKNAWPSTEPWLERDAGFFVSSPHAVTPAHSDRHHNLLLQLSGRKQVAFVAPGSREHAAALARSLPSMWVDSMPAGAEIVELAPGRALYLPPFAIHWVHNDERTVAISCGWSSAATLRTGAVHGANASLRRIGVPAQAVGGWSDGMRLRAVAVARRLKRIGAAA